MLTAARAVTRAVSTADPLPEVPALAAWYAAGVRPRKGQLIMVAGLPKAGKSNFAMWWVAEMRLPTLYFSADMSQHTASTRLSAWASGHTVEAVTRAFEHGAGELYADDLADCPIQWCFDSSPSTEDVHLELDAYIEAHERYPSVICIDNMLNIQASEEFSGQQFIMQELHSLARLTGATVIVLHHCSEGQVKDSAVTKPPPRSAIMNKINQLPELIFTVALEPAASEFRVACVANRNGRGDPTGETYIRLRADIERCQFSHNVHQSWGYQDSSDDD